MFDKVNWRGHFNRPRQPDPVVVEATRIFEQHRNRLFDQATALIESRVAEAAQPAVSDEPGYGDFVRARRHSLLQKLATDVRLQELQEQTEQAEARQELTKRLQAAQQTLLGAPERLLD